MQRRKTKILIFVFVSILVTCFAAFMFYQDYHDGQIAKDDSYFWNKYGYDTKNHDACVSEFTEKGQSEGRLIGIPCPGEPQ